MPYLRTTIGPPSGVQKTELSMVIQDLQYPANTYDLLKIYKADGISVTLTGQTGGQDGVENYRSGIARFYNLTPGITYGFRGEARHAAGGTLHDLGWYYFTTLPADGGGGDPDPPPDTKPSALGWADKTSGDPFSLQANSWNNMTDKINEWRAYQGKSNLSFTTAYSGGALTAAMFNQVCNAISTLSPPISQPATVSTGDTVTAAKINRISDSIDSLL